MHLRLWYHIIIIKLKNKLHFHAFFFFLYICNCPDVYYTEPKWSSVKTRAHRREKKNTYEFHVMSDTSATLNTLALVALYMTNQ